MHLVHCVYLIGVFASCMLWNEGLINVRERSCYWIIYNDCSVDHPSLWSRSGISERNREDTRILCPGAISVAEIYTAFRRSDGRMQWEACVVDAGSGRWSIGAAIFDQLRWQGLTATREGGYKEREKMEDGDEMHRGRLYLRRGREGNGWRKRRRKQWRRIRVKGCN